MEKFREFSEKFYVKELSLIFLVSLILFWLFYGKQDVFLVDVGREAYLPWQMLKGKVLYKDLFNVYGPLGYQINAVLFKLFGTNLNTLYFAGFINSLVILFTTFFSAKLFADKKIALALTGLTMAVCVYIRTLFNFIFTYSYCAVYALSGFLLSMLTMLLYIKDRKSKYLILSFLFAGFSFANKIEDLPYFCFIFLCLPFFLKKDWKNYFHCLAAFFVFPVISFGVLLLQGVSLGDLLSAVDLVKRLVAAPSVEYFYNAYGLYFNPLQLKVSLGYLGKVLALFVPCSVSYYFLNYTRVNLIKNEGVKKFLSFLIFVLSAVLIYKSFHSFYPSAERLFCWLGVANILVFIGFMINKKFNLSNFETIDKMFIFTLISAILVSVKGLFAISTECYGTFSLAALFIPFIIFLARYVPEGLKRFKFFDGTVYLSAIINLILIVIVSYITLNIYKFIEKPISPVKTEKGKIFVREAMKSQNDFIKFIKKETPKNSVMVSVPEGALINFLAQRDSSDLYYYLIPVNVEVFGEEKIIDDFKKNPPDYFLMNNVPYSPFNKGTFCDYAPKTCSYIKNNYEAVARTNDSLEFVLYKIKNKDKN